MNSWKIVVERRNHEPRCPVCNASRRDIKIAIDAFRGVDTVFKCGVCSSVLLMVKDNE